MSTPAASARDVAEPQLVGSLRVKVLVFGIGAALLSWLMIEATLDTFKPATSARQLMGSTFMLAGSQERVTAATRNAALAWGLTGATVGLALGLVGGLARRSSRSALATAFVGLMLGGGAGAGASLVALPVAAHVHDRDPGNMSGEMAASLISHGAIWGAIGAVGGLAFGIGTGGQNQAFRGLLAGLLGAGVGAILYELIGALVLPDTKILEPVAATRGLRILAQALAVIPATIGVAASVSAAYFKEG